MINKSLLVIITVGALFLHGLLYAQETQRDARQYFQDAVKAYKDKDYAAYLENMTMAVRLRPDQSRYIYNLAGAYALAGKRSEALASLGLVAEMGMIYPAERDTDFDSIKDSEEFKQILKKFEANKAHVGTSSTAFKIQEKGLITEGLAYDAAADAFYVSSVRGRKIIKVDRSGRVSDFATERDGLWSAMGMKVDRKRRHLWVATAAVPQMINFREEEKGLSGLLKFDLKSGKLVKKYILPKNGKPHWLGDLAVNSRGDVYATDSLSPALYRLREGREEFETLIEGAPFASPQGLDFSTDERRLFIADYARGIFVYDVESGKSAQLSPPKGATLLGIDGLYFYSNTLVCVQNGTRPQRVIRIYLNTDGTRAERLEVIEANNPLFDEPTLGVMVKDSFYYIANSQWGAVDEKGVLAPQDKLREPVVLKTKLTQSQKTKL